VNDGSGGFYEISRQAGVDGSEWSWASLIQDFDNDGLKDLYISNGIYKDLLDKDYLNYFANDTRVKSMIDSNLNVIQKLVDNMPSSAVVNHMYKNEGSSEFEMVSDDWGLGQKTFSNGSAYGDLDNDGDLDIVLNNANMPAFIYENKTDTAITKSLQIELTGYESNSLAIGSKVEIKYDNKTAMVENFTSRGFQSSVSPVMHFGLGNIEKVDEVKIIWPDGNVSRLKDKEAGSRLSINYADTPKKYFETNSSKGNSKKNETVLNFVHEETSINQFGKERLLTQMTAYEGPGLAVADVNNDGKDDVFVGGGKNQSSALLLSSKNGGYEKVTEVFKSKKSSEVVKAIFLDVDGDNDKDLYVAHGGKIFSKFVPELNDIIYLNDGNGRFLLAPKLFKFPYPISTGDVAVADLNNDEIDDIVIGERMKTELYGKPGSTHLIMSEGAGKYKTESPLELRDIGMITSVELADTNADGKQEIILAGEWMPITIIKSSDNFSDDISVETIPNSRGLWHDVELVDIDKDGDLDILAGNSGLNTHYTNGMQMCTNDYDGNGSQEQLICKVVDGKYYSIHDVDEMYSQLPVLRKKFQLYKDIAKADMESLVGKEGIDGATILKLEELKSVVYLNEGEGYKKIALPVECQYSSVYAIHAVPETDGVSVLVGGNYYNVKPQFGRQDASQGWKFDTKNVNGELEFGDVESLNINGQIRSIQSLDDKFIFAINSDSLKVYN